MTERETLERHALHDSPNRLLFRDRTQLALARLARNADPHGLAIDWLSVPAAAYFVYVAHALYSGKFRDWNRGPVASHTPAPESGAAAAAASGS